MGEEPKLVRRRINRQSTIRSGRTISERREKLETANERMVARKKDKRKKRFRVFFVSVCFLIIVFTLAMLYFLFFEDKDHYPINTSETYVTYEPSIEIIDEDSNSVDGKITERMRSYIGQAEADFRELGYKPTKVVIPTGAIREVDFYLDGYTGFLKLIIDRETAVSVEDADRMLRYLSEQGISDFQYIDVRVVGKAYWR